MEWIQRHGPPQMTWLVAALLVQRERQRWHHAITRRGLALSDDRGPLPGMPGWTYQCHGIGVALQAPDGEFLDVDFRDEVGAVIDVWFFAARVESLQNAEGWLAERRLWRWRPLAGVIVDGCDELVERGAAAYVPGHKALIVLSPDLDARAAEAAHDLAAPGAAARWLAALEPGGEAAQLAQHHAWMRTRIRRSPRGADYLQLALPTASVGDVLELCRPFLSRIDAQTGRMLEQLRTRPDAPALPEVASLLRRASLTETHPFLAYQACAYLLERDLERAITVERFDAWSTLSAAKGFRGNPMQARFAMLALRHLPDRALGLVRASLRSTTPDCVQEMAALLAAIDQRWCRRELAAALAEPPRRTHGYLAAALRSTRGEIAKQTTAAGHTTPTGTTDATSHAASDAAAATSHAADAVFAVELRRFQPLAEELRGIYPEDWDGSWPVALRRGPR